jgi:catechol 2,3-dioxygenase-like lactoylglutathione lyase family enzyme
MPVETTILYSSPNGDRWLLCRDADQMFVRHEPNAPSGGLASEIDIDTFLSRRPWNPEHRALLHLLEKAIDRRFDATRPAQEMRPHAFVLAVPDLERSVRYFVDVLGFQPEWRDEDNWQLLTRGNVRLMLGHFPDAPSAQEIGDHSYFAYILVEDVDALQTEFADKGAIILHAPESKPWGKREMAVATPDGHRMIFGQSV